MSLEILVRTVCLGTLSNQMTDLLKMVNKPRRRLNKQRVGL